MCQLIFLNMLEVSLINILSITQLSFKFKDLNTYNIAKLKEEPISMLFVWLTILWLYTIEFVVWINLQYLVIFVISHGRICKDWQHHWIPFCKEVILAAHSIAILTYFQSKKTSWSIGIISRQSKIVKHSHKHRNCILTYFRALAGAWTGWK